MKPITAEQYRNRFEREAQRTGSPTISWLSVALAVARDLGMIEEVTEYTTPRLREAETPNPYLEKK